MIVSHGLTSVADLARSKSDANCGATKGMPLVIGRAHVDVAA
jgi:hypothetical protein